MNADASRRDRQVRTRLRVTRFLARGAATPCMSADGGSVLLETADRGTISIPKDAIEHMVKQGLVRAANGRLMLSAEGIAHARRAEAPEEPFRAQNADLGSKTVEVDGARETVRANLAESPLAHLARRRTRKGKPFLDTHEFDAGERLRADYTRGRIMPRMGAHWQASVASSRRDGNAGGAVELTDAALAARQRVDHALDAVGPELSGVLVDVCCFLKGLERVETERGWPVRSAKVVLKTALAALNRHYRPNARQDGDRNRILHWGAEGYRPTTAG